MSSWKKLILSGSDAEVASLDILSTTAAPTLEVPNGGNIEFPNIPVQPGSGVEDLPEGTLVKSNTEIDGGWNIMVANGTFTEVPGCTNPNAENYNPLANVDDGSCTYSTTINLPTNPTTPLVDIDNNGTVATADLLTFLTGFGGEYTDSPSWPSYLDFDGDGGVGTSDLLLLLSKFGEDVDEEDNRPTINWTGGDYDWWAGAGDQLIPDPTFTDGIDGWGHFDSRGSIEYDSNSDLLRMLPTGTNGNILLRSNVLTPGSSYKVVFKARGTKADESTAQGSAFSSIGDIEQLGNAVANNTLTADWQDYEFYITPNSHTLRLYLASTEDGDIIEFDDVYVYADNYVTSASVNTYYETFSNPDDFWDTLPSQMQSYDNSIPKPSHNVKAYIEQTGFSASIELFTYLYFDQTTGDNATYIPGYTITGGNSLYTKTQISGSYP